MRVRKAACDFSQFFCCCCSLPNNFRIFHNPNVIIKDIVDGVCLCELSYDFPKYMFSKLWFLSLEWKTSSILFKRYELLASNRVLNRYFRLKSQPFITFTAQISGDAQLFEKTTHTIRVQPTALIKFLEIYYTAYVWRGGKSHKAHKILFNRLSV